MNRYELLRYERGLTRPDVTRGSGVPESTLRALETGQVERPSAPTAQKLARFYRISVAELLGIEANGVAR